MIKHAIIEGQPSGRPDAPAFWLATAGSPEEAAQFKNFFASVIPAYEQYGLDCGFGPTVEDVEGIVADAARGRIEPARRRGFANLIEDEDYLAETMVPMRIDTLLSQLGELGAAATTERERIKQEAASLLPFREDPFVLLANDGGYGYLDSYGRILPSRLTINRKNGDFIEEELAFADFIGANAARIQCEVVWPEDDDSGDGAPHLQSNLEHLTFGTMEIKGTKNAFVPIATLLHANHPVRQSQPGETSARAPYAPPIQ